MHLVKELIGFLTAPLPVAFAIAAAAGLCRALGRRRAAAWLLAVAGLTVYLGASGLVGNALLGPLERRYPPLSVEQPLPGVGYVVVLGSGYLPRDHIPITAALDEDGLVRIVEGVRLARRLGAVRLLVSGGAPPGTAAPALGYAELARELGIADSALIISASPLDTAAEARAVATRLGRSPFILVTSAYHMRRAVRLMQRVGAQPIPAPTEQLVAGATLRWTDLLPSCGGLRKTGLALHEYLGLAAIAAHLD